MQANQSPLPPWEWDWSFLEYFRKSIELGTDPEYKEQTLHSSYHSEATRDMYCGSMKQMNPLIQFDSKPNRQLKEAKVELYKISISFLERSGG